LRKSWNVALEVYIGFVTEPKLDPALQILDMQVALPGAKDSASDTATHEIREGVGFYLNPMPKVVNRKIATKAEHHRNASRAVSNEEIRDVPHVHQDLRCAQRLSADFVC
jgi:hypothetical protein